MATLITFGEDLERGPVTINFSQVASVEWYGMLGEGDKSGRQPSGAKVNYAFDDNVSSTDHLELDENYAAVLYDIVRQLDARAGD